MSTFQARKINKPKPTPTQCKPFELFGKLRCFHSCNSTRWDNIYRLYEHIIKFNAICNCCIFPSNESQIIVHYVKHFKLFATMSVTESPRRSYGRVEFRKLFPSSISSTIFLAVFKVSITNYPINFQFEWNVGKDVEWFLCNRFTYFTFVRHSLEHWMHWISNYFRTRAW